MRAETRLGPVPGSALGRHYRSARQVRQDLVSGEQTSEPLGGFRDTASDWLSGAWDAVTDFATKTWLTVVHLRSAVAETFSDGSAWDSLQGAVTQMIDVMLFGLPDLSGWIDPLYGHEDAHQMGTYVGTAWGTANWIVLSFYPWAAAPEGTGVVVTHWGPKGMTALRSGDWVMRGRPNLVRYILSGVEQPGKHFAWPWNFIVERVPSSTLHAPGGWEAIKWLLGQRIYIP